MDGTEAKPKIWWARSPTREECGLSATKVIGHLANLAGQSNSKMMGLSAIWVRQATNKKIKQIQNTKILHETKKIFVLFFKTNTNKKMLFS